MTSILEFVLNFKARFDNSKPGLAMENIFEHLMRQLEGLGTDQDLNIITRIILSSFL
jgi:hypothetical protein